jgi:hypothetical protein
LDEIVAVMAGWKLRRGMTRQGEAEFRSCPWKASLLTPEISVPSWFADAEAEELNTGADFSEN